MYCNNCGDENPITSKFCSSCGSSLGKNSEELIELEVNLKSNSPKKGFNRFSRLQQILALVCLVLSISLVYMLVQSRADENNFSAPMVQEEITSNSNNEVLEESTASDSTGYNADPGSFVWQRNLDMTGVGTWNERSEEDWQEDVGQQFLFINQVGCLFYVFDENSDDRDLMNRAYQWLSQYSGVHIAGSNWILMDSSYGEKCTGPVTDTFGGYRVN
jgi:hypothetical protein